MSTFNRFEDIEAWKVARDLANQVFRLTLEGDFQRDFALRDQIRRASGSIMDNIAEGFARDGNREFVQFLFVAKGSATEVQSQLYRAKDQGYISEETFQSLYDQARYIIAMLVKLIKYLKTSSKKGLKYD